MSQSTSDWGRTNPPGNDESSESEEEQKSLAGFSKSAPGTFRSKVASYETQTQFPTPPTYKLNEEVYLLVAGQSQPTGPFQVAAILPNHYYKLKRKDNGQEHPHSVKEGDLVQDVLIELEQQLTDLDNNEINAFFLNSRRSDENTARLALLSEIEVKLKEYGRVTDVDIQPADLGHLRYNAASLSSANRTTSTRTTRYRKRRPLAGRQ
ncbi:MAG: hypothetical protein Q9161_009519 [Pseudevernia consocians]